MITKDTVIDFFCVIDEFDKNLNEELAKNPRKTHYKISPFLVSNFHKYSSFHPAKSLFLLSGLFVPSFFRMANATLPSNEKFCAALFRFRPASSVQSVFYLPMFLEVKSFSALLSNDDMK